MLPLSRSLITLRACGYIIGVIVLAACVSNPFRLPFLVSEQTRREIVVVNCILCGCAGTLHYTTPSPMHLTPYTSASKPFPTPQPLNPSLSVYALTLWLRRHSTLHNTPFALHPTLYNLRPTSRTSHPPCTFTLVPQLLYALP